ncbi:sensor histidine kinase [Melittangium boletus]|uniref:sensor histidine kinase n=1 Tax=Melittangium boletus TaxID=83453 RepID=UPI003DA65D14
MLIFVFSFVDILLLGRVNPWTLGCRAGWAVSMLGYAFFAASGSQVWERRLKDLHVLIVSGCVLGIVGTTGGTASPYFVLVTALPLANCLLYRQGRRAALLSGAVGGLGTFAMSWWEQSTLLLATIHTSIVLAVTLFSLHLAHQVRLTQDVEQQARLERARRESLEALAVSEHRRAQAEKLAAIGRLASEVAHEINNPLAYVGANIDFVQESLRPPASATPAELSEVLDQTREGLLHIQRVVADLKGFARMDAPEPVRCVLADVVADALRLASLRLKHVARLRVDVPRELPEIFGVRQRLVQVVLNLLVNAGDVLSERGGPEAAVDVRGVARGGRVLLFIEDNGPGFSPEVLPHVFEAFFTTKGPDQGTGLGLSLSRELVAQFGGELSASNRPEGGARLCLEFPAPTDAASV